MCLLLFEVLLGKMVHTHVNCKQHMYTAGLMMLDKFTIYIISEKLIKFTIENKLSGQFSVLIQSAVIATGHCTRTHTRTHTHNATNSSYK